MFYDLFLHFEQDIFQSTSDKNFNSCLATGIDLSHKFVLLLLFIPFS